ncbi:MAG TPA: hypothetical protein VFE84_04865 [Patescibacteria group bacterium]|jgi:hypothetical protein|nr:hypothetical protein [Patescibacteria group bacterium]
MPRSSSALARELTTIRTSFSRLASAFGRIAPYLVIEPESISLNSDGRRRRKPRLSAAQRAALKLQGKYMGTMRGLKPRQIAEVKKIRETKGIRAAIKAAEKLAR